MAMVMLLQWQTSGQPLPLSIAFDSDIIWAGVDRPGDLFLVMASGEVQKVDKTGRKIGAHKFQSPPTLLDPLDGVQSFYFKRSGRQYGNMSYDFTDVTQQTLDPAFAISPWLVCPALRELWILDSADYSIKKTAQHSLVISLETAMQHLPKKQMTDYIHMREYQNYVFLLDRKAGVHMFNPLGRFVRTLGEPNLEYFNFLGEEIYYMSGKQVVLVDLYTNEKRTLPASLDCRFVLLTDERNYSVGRRTVSISEFKPE